MRIGTYKRCKCRDGTGKELGAACPKLRRHSGSWSPSHGSWYGKYELPPGPGGKRIDLRLGGFRTEAAVLDYFEAAARLLAIPRAGPRGHDARMEIRKLIKAARRAGADLPRYDDLKQRYLKGAALQSATTGDYLDRWLAGKRDVKRNTIRGYESHVRVHLRGPLADVPLDELQVADIDAVFTRIRERNDRITRGETRGRPTGLVTQQRILATLRNALEDAIPQGLIGYNPAKLVKLTSQKRARPLVWTDERVNAWRAHYDEERAGRSAGAFKVWLRLGLRPSQVMVWTPAQLGAFLDRAREHRLYALFHLIAMTGLRRGEACGLGWADVDLDARTLLVRTQIVQLGWAAVEGDPKTESSETPVVFDEETGRVLRAHRRRQREDRLAWGRAWVESGKVFTRENGEALHPATATDQFERVAFEAGLPPIRLHDLRHGVATLGLAAGLDIKVVSAMLRHSTVTITADTYALVLPELAGSAAEAVAGMVPRAAVATEGLPSVSRRPPAGRER